MEHMPMVCGLNLIEYTVRYTVSAKTSGGLRVLFLAYLQKNMINMKFPAHQPGIFEQPSSLF